MQRSVPAAALLLVALVLILLSAPSSSGRTWYIKADGTGDAPTIQAGIDSSAVGDTVLVACGIYYESDIEMESGIALASETGNPSCVTIDAHVEYPGTARVILCVDVDASATIRGFRITGGVLYDGNGAGIYCESSDVTIADCMVEWNNIYHLGGHGAGLYCAYSNPQIVDCSFVGNSIIFVYHYGGGSGAGVYCGSSSPVFTNCIFDQNVLQQEWGGCPVPGGAVFCGGGTPEFINCSFTHNRAEMGGAVFVGSGNASFVDCTFLDNIGSTALGNEGTVAITSSTFAGNRAGFACICSFSMMSVTNTILAFTSCGQAMVGVRPNIQCCNVFGNEGGDWVGALEGLEGMSGNFGAWPLFCDPGSRNYTLSGTSPCLPGNNPCGVLIGAHWQGCGAIALVEKSWGMIKSLYR